jgi:UDP-glucose 4-epimerase
MTVLLTGGIGFIGSHIFLELIQDYNVVIIDNFSNSNYDQVKRLEKLTNKSINVYAIDLLNINLVNKVFVENKIKYVIHLAGLKSVNDSITEPLFYYSHNLQILFNLLTVMKKFGCKNLVFSSSATVYGDNIKNSSFSEDDKTGVNITNPYGKTKYFQEEVLKDLYKSDSDYNITILRYFNPAGAHSSGIIGEDPQVEKPTNLFPNILRSIKEKTELKIYGKTHNTHDGTCIRDFIHVVDLAKAHVKVLNLKGLNIYNVGTGIKTSILDVLSTFENVNEIKLDFSFTAPRQGDLSCVYADCSKICKEIRWKAEKNLEDICRDVYMYFVNNNIS